MKKMLYAVLFCGILQLSQTGAEAQNATQDSVPYNVVLIEDFGGTWCSSCPRVTDSLAKLEQEFANLAIIGYQIGEVNEEVNFFYNTDAYARNGYYDTIRYYPSLFVNGSEANIYRPYGKVDSARNKKTPYRLELSVNHIPDRAISRDSFQIKVKISRNNPDKSRKIRLYIAFTQDHFAYKWYNQTELNHALTFMYPDGNGTEVVLDETGKAEFSFNFGADYSKSHFPVKNGSITAFIQDDTFLRYDTLRDGKVRAVRDKTILQADKVYLGNGDYTQINEDELQGADFHNRHPEIADRRSARFYDNTFGQVDAWHWEFEGGEPAVSDLPSPTVFYAEPGNYAATLTVNKNGKTSSIRKENVISVLDISPKFVLDPPMARPNQTVKIQLVSKADECDWILPGGSAITASGKEVSTSYFYEGQYNIQVKTSYTSPQTKRVYTFDSTAKNVITISKDAPVANGNPDLTEKTRITPLQNGLFLIQGTKGDLEYADVFSINGQQILRTKTPEFDLSTYPSGMYVVCVKTRNNRPVSVKIQKF
ncbi:MAG: PKD domain-containing protein [Bacteroides sp.]|nr:PKD domain-containing protein [Bacteroides sp.]MCM1086292.1 PKD domain-containing protein [Bacteroides sp.]MCM1169033.1 PKD domain-containing protein [Bacteroides sp.]